MWTTQDHDHNSYKPISKIIEGQGYDPGTPAYWEKFEEEKRSAIDECLKACQTCENVPTLEIHGPETTTKPGNVGYSSTGGRGGFTWQVSGAGVSMNPSQPGVVDLSDQACGSFTVTVMDSCGNAASKDVRITNNGRWVGDPSHSGSNCAYSVWPTTGCPCGNVGENISGKTKVVYSGCEEFIDTAGFESYGCEQLCTPTFVRDYQEGEGQPDYSWYKGWENINAYIWEC
jgi:hypothetical protein